MSDINIRRKSEKPRIKKANYMFLCRGKTQENQFFIGIGETPLEALKNWYKRGQK